MNGDLFPITKAELVAQVSNVAGAEYIIDAAAFADPLFVAKLGPVVLGFVAFIPTSTLSDDAYVWAYITPEGWQHRVAVARIFWRWRDTIHLRYRRLIAHCTTRIEHQEWMRFIGAKSIGTEHGLIKFVVEA